MLLLWFSLHFCLRFLIGFTITQYLSMMCLIEFSKSLLITHSLFLDIVMTQPTFTLKNIISNLTHRNKWQNSQKYWISKVWNGGSVYKTNFMSLEESITRDGTLKFAQRNEAECSQKVS